MIVFLKLIKEISSNSTMVFLCVDLCPAIFCVQCQWNDNVNGMRMEYSKKDYIFYSKSGNIYLNYYWCLIIRNGVGLDIGETVARGLILMEIHSQFSNISNLF